MLHEEGGDKNMKEWRKRETWQGKLDFFIACVGCSVGLGNVWRFPYLCYKNGGGAFLIPYFIFAFVGGMPIFFLEIAIGQFMSKGGPQAWTIVPIFQGIGVTSTVVIFILNCYYNVILAWIVYYLWSSFTDELPWDTCDHEWNTPNCRADFSSKSNLTRETGMNRTSSVTEFWENKVLNISGGLEIPGKIKWDLALCLLLAWIIVYGCVCKGIKSSGKVMYITATCPYLFMFLLIGRNCTLDGSVDGIQYYLQANLTKLTETEVWVDAGTQILFSWGLGMGTLTVLGSYNKFKHNSIRDALAFSAVNAFTSFLAGFIVFTILGFMAKQQGVLVSGVAESGPGLAFIAYPKAVSQLPISPMWSILFFVMLLLLGFDTQFVGVEGVITAIVDQYPRFLRKGYRREAFIGVMCFVMFCIGLSMVTEGGMYVFQMFDFYIGSRMILVVALCEMIAISYCYGVRRFANNVRMMIGNTWMQHTLPYFQICWAIFSPIFCIVLLIFNIYNYSNLTYERSNGLKYNYPDWTRAIGWLFACFIVIWIPLVAIYRLCRLIWIGGHITREDLHLLLVPYNLSEHQKLPGENDQRCLSDFEKGRKPEYDMVDHIGYSDV